MWLSSTTDGISAAQKNAGIIVIILAILQVHILILHPFFIPLTKKKLEWVPFFLIVRIGIFEMGDPDRQHAFNSCSSRFRHPSHLNFFQHALKLLNMCVQNLGRRAR